MDEFARGGGKKDFAKWVAFSLLSFTSTSVLLAFLTFRVGILGLPPSLMGFLMYLSAVHISFADISSR